MSDTHQIHAIQRQFEDIQRQLADLKLAVSKLTSGSDRRRETTQCAVDKIQDTLDVIFRNVHVPNVVFKPGVKHRID